MVSSGLRDAGYVYLNLDDKWMDDDGRDGSGRLVGDSERFPSGMAALADYVHGRGLKFGLYGDRGTDTCAHYNAKTPCESGSYGREEVDAETFASWGVDYLKYDNCAIAPGRDNDQAQEEDYRAMAGALKATGRPIVFSICAWDAKPWMPSVGHLWRSTFDIGLCFSGCDEWYRNIDEIIDENDETSSWAGPGHWNDPDMMVVGNGLPYHEDVAHFSMWALMAAPIILGNDIRTMSDETLRILTNEEVIAVNQDPAGIQGRRVTDNGDLEVWLKPLCTADGPEKAVVLLNRSGSSAEISVSFRDIGIMGSATVRDLWEHTDLGQRTGSFSAQVASHAVVMLKVVATDG
jgi:alpha-galactosidase